MRKPAGRVDAGIANGPLTIYASRGHAGLVAASLQVRGTRAGAEPD